MRVTTWIAVLLPAVSGAQQVLGSHSTLPFDAPESWAMKYFTTVSLLTSQGLTPEIDVGSVRLGLEVENIPYLSPARSTVGFGGTKQEDLNKLPVLVRPRLTVGLPWQLSATLSIVPPVRVLGVRPSLFAFSIGRPLVNRTGAVIALRAYGQLGDVEGDFTCSAKEAAAGSDSQRNPFGCEQASTDRISMSYLGLELGAGYRLGALHDLMPYVLLAGNYLDSSFTVHARYAGVVDQTLLQTHGFTGSGAVGLSLPVNQLFSASGQVFYSPMFVRRPPTGTLSAEGLVNVRLMIDFKLH
jgi:hypothetical protein